MLILGAPEGRPRILYTSGFHRNSCQGLIMVLFFPCHVKTQPPGGGNDNNNYYYYNNNINNNNYYYYYYKVKFTVV